MRSLEYSFNIIVAGKSILQYEHDKNYFVEGRKGSEFEIEITNHSSKRILAIPSVDGLDTIEGKAAGLDSKGYIVSPFSTLRVPGWTIDNQAVAKFVFQDKEKSYAQFASETGAKNIGVIGFLIFEDKDQVVSPISHQYRWYPYPVARGVLFNGDPTGGFSAHGVSTSNTVNNIITGSNVSYQNAVSASTAPITTDSFSLGTGFGDKASFKTDVQTFNKGRLIHSPVIYYDNRKNLIKRGVIKIEEKINSLPNAFPGIGCKLPPGYKG